MMSRDQLMERIARQFEVQRQLNLNMVLYHIWFRARIMGMESVLFLDDQQTIEQLREKVEKLQEIVLDIINKRGKHTFYELWEALDDCFGDTEKAVFKEALTLLRVLE